MKYRKKPVVIEAVQLTWTTWGELCDFIGRDFQKLGMRGCYVDNDGKETEDASNNRIGLVIPTLEGDMLAIQEDYVIRGVKGEYYPCKPDIFELTYEKAE